MKPFEFFAKCHALTRAMAIDFAAHNIRVVSMSPGSVRTPILELAARTFDGEDADVDAVFRRFGQSHPLGRIGETEEVAALAAFLARRTRLHSLPDRITESMAVWCTLRVKSTILRNTIVK